MGPIVVVLAVGVKVAVRAEDAGRGVGGAEDGDGGGGGVEEGARVFEDTELARCSCRSHIRQ